MALLDVRGYCECFGNRSHVVALKIGRTLPRQIASRSGERQSGCGEGGEVAVKLCEEAGRESPDVSQAPGLLQAREKMEGRGLQPSCRSPCCSRADA